MYGRKIPGLGTRNWNQAKEKASDRMLMQS